MWLHRVLFNVKTRLLNQKSEEEHQSRPPMSWIPSDAENKARIVQTRIDDLDERMAHLQTH